MGLFWSAHGVWPEQICLLAGCTHGTTGTFRSYIVDLGDLTDNFTKAREATVEDVAKMAEKWTFHNVKYVL
jgi:hypothetical protein